MWNGDDSGGGRSQWWKVVKACGGKPSKSCDTPRTAGRRVLQKALAHTKVTYQENFLTNW